ncbi:MAG: ABC transporter ATP-binding protein, partial [Chitinophagaceae bacterium]
YFPSMALLVGLSTLIAVMAGGLDVINGVEGASVGKIAEFVMYIQMLTFPVSAIGWTASMTQRAVASQQRINEFLQTQPEITDSPDAFEVTVKGNIIFDNVSFTYPHTGITAIKNLSFEIKAGEKIAVIGSTGSGKSTLAQLLLRMMDPTSGIIILDGIALQKHKLKNLREGISYVPQEVFLFSDTIRNNILFGNRDANENEMENAARVAAIQSDITGFKEGYETMVGERGLTLSGGQKQRISIARGLVKDPQMIILDDCLSAVDSETEKRILNGLDKFLHGKTAIVVTHRIFSLMQFDRILVLDDGELAEQGTHESLVKLNSIYAGLYRKQQEEWHENRAL